MLAAARTAAAHASQAFTLIAGKAEDLPDDIGGFDVVTIGRALHWMDREATLARLERLVAPEGVILVCASYSAADGRNPWLDEYNTARRAWSKESLWSEAGSAGRTHRDLAGFFAGTRFHAADVIRVETSHEVSVRDLARRVLTFSSSSPDVLGDRSEAMLRDVEQRLLPLSRDGVLTEVVRRRRRRWRGDRAQWTMPAGSRSSRAAADAALRDAGFVRSPQINPRKICAACQRRLTRRRC